MASSMPVGQWSHRCMVLLPASRNSLSGSITKGPWSAGGSTRECKKISWKHEFRILSETLPSYVKLWMTLTPYLQASIYWTSSLSRPQNPGYWHWARAKSMQVLKNVGLAFASSRELQHKSRHAPMQHCHCHFMGYLLFEDFFLSGSLWISGSAKVIYKAFMISE